MIKCLKTILLIGLSLPLFGRYHQIRRFAEFDKLISQYQMSIVCFASPDQQDFESKHEAIKEYKSIMQMLKNASQRDDFKTLLGKDIGFLMVDTSRPEMQDALVENKISDEHQPLCFVIDQDNPEACQKQIKPATSYDLIQLLYDVGGKDLQNLIKEKREDLRLEREERIAYWRANPGFYGYSGWGWGRPLGWGPYWGPAYGYGFYW